MIGRTVSHYRILSPLGSGGMGVVYLAEDSRLGRQVAVKFLPSTWSQEAKALERFRVEARAASSLSHPGICAIYDIGQDGDTPFIVMEALKGETLRERITKGQLRVADVLDIGIQLADALEAAHAQGIVHRDIKPANIFLGDRNRVKVLDFGLAKLLSWSSPLSGSEDTTSPSDRQQDNQITQPGTALGTVSYMSPEQARGEEIDSRSDLFAFGAVLYEMVTGNQAFSGATNALVYDAILNRAPRSIGEVNALVPPRLEAVIATALEKERELRYQHASDLEAELKRIRRDLDSGSLAVSQAGLSTSRTIAPPLAAPAAHPAIAPTRRWERASIAIALIAVVIAAVVVWRGMKTPEDRAATPVADGPVSPKQPAPVELATPRTTSPPVPVSIAPQPRTTTRAEAPPQARGSLPAPPAPVPTAPSVSSLPATPAAPPAAPEEVRSQPTPAAVTPPPPAEPATPPPAPVQPPVQPLPPPPRTATAEAPPPAAAPVETDEASIRRVIGIYERAIETKDVALFRSVRPNLSRAAETVLTNSFRQIDSQQIDLRIESLRIDGRTASARIVRRDTLTTAGRRQVQNSTQTLRFEKTDAGWIIAE